MKNLFKILILSLLVFSCESPNEPEGCDGVSGSGLVYDECGVCGGDGLDCGGGCNEYVELWDWCYNIGTTTILNLSYSNLSGEIPPSIGDLINLTMLELYGNQLLGSIPIEIGNLTKLIDLNLGNNQLTGSIPIEIEDLTSLFELSLVSNQLSGQIPPEIGNLTNLGKLFLQNNNLSGNVPFEICELGLIQFGIHNNQLCPSYPSCIDQYDIDSQDTSNCPED